jgi:hypothetical protein
VLPYSIVKYVETCESGFGAALEIERAHVHESEGISILVLTFRYYSPDRLSTVPGEYWLNASVGDGAVVFDGAIDKTFPRGISDVVTVSEPLTAEQAMGLATTEAVEVSYWIWVGVPYRGSGSALTGSESVTLEVA